MRRIIAPVMLAVLAWTSAARGDALRATLRPEHDAVVSQWLTRGIADLVETYEQIHANPELSLEEHKTARVLASGLERAGYDVTQQVGGTGVVGVLENGDGRTLLIRADMDALPVTEKTGLAYASTVTTTRPGGGTVGVAHACGHDVHTTALLGTARLLSDLRDRWRGTLVMIGQPAEEVGKGALMMLEDGLFERFPKPDAVLALHVIHDMPVGQIGYTPGWWAANVDSVDITVHGRGGHGARPHEAVDPVVAAAYIVTGLQTLVSRRVTPVEPAVVTVGSIHGGSKHNIIPNEVRMQLTVRSYTDEVRTQLLEGIRQVATDTCKAFGCPVPPTVTVKKEYTPAAYNDPALVELAVDVFREVFGEGNVIELPHDMGGEDFGRYAHAIAVPGFLFRIGAVSREAYEASLRPDGPRLPSLHSGTFAPVAEPTLHMGVRAMSTLVLALLATPSANDE